MLAVLAADLVGVGVDEDNLPPAVAVELTILYLIILLLSTIYSKIFYKVEDKLPGMEVDAVKIKELRERQVLSLSELEEKSGVDRQIIWRIESGYQKGAHQKTIRKLAAALGVEPYDLTQGEG